jgi:hypothetical protein
MIDFSTLKIRHFEVLSEFLICDDTDAPQLSDDWIEE